MRMVRACVFEVAHVSNRFVALNIFWGAFVIPSTWVIEEQRTIQLLGALVVFTDRPFVIGVAMVRSHRWRPRDVFFEICGDIGHLDSAGGPLHVILAAVSVFVAAQRGCGVSG